MSEMMRQMTKLEEQIDKLALPKPQQKVISPPIENCYLPPTIQPECESDNGMELEDNSRYQLMTELMSQIIELTNLVEKLTAQQELQRQTIKSYNRHFLNTHFPKIIHSLPGQSCTIDLPRALYLMIHLGRRIMVMRPKISILWQV